MGDHVVAGSPRSTGRLGALLHVRLAARPAAGPPTLLPVRWRVPRSGPLPAMLPVLAAALLAVLLAACGSIGATTTRIDAAEAEVDALFAEVVAVLDLDVLAEQPFGRRAACEQPGLGAGLSNTRSLRATLPEGDPAAATQQVAAVLTAAGYTVTDPDRGEGVFARRDGIRLSLLLDPVRQTTELDANTGCRLAPAS